jgi:hypothetical protein
LILVFLFFRFTPLGLAMRAAARNPVSSRLVGIRVGRMSAFGWGLAAAIGAAAGMMAAPLVYLDPDMMSGIQEINDPTNDSSLVTPSKLHSTKCLKAILLKHDIAHQSHYKRKQIREYELR